MKIAKKWEKPQKWPNFDTKNLSPHSFLDQI